MRISPYARLFTLLLCPNPQQLSRSEVTIMCKGVAQNNTLPSLLFELCLVLNQNFTSCILMRNTDPPILTIPKKPDFRREV
jgi:hypothetical protein